MSENFDIDGLVSYQKKTISDTRMLVNPAYKLLESQLRSLNGKLTKQKTLFATTTLKSANETGKKLERSIAKKAEIHEQIKEVEA